MLIIKVFALAAPVEDIIVKLFKTKLTIQEGMQQLTSMRQVSNF
jgi:hypothetical protein